MLLRRLQQKNDISTYYQEVKTMYDANESDWKLFRKLLPGWQEAYMERLCKEYAEILRSGKAASDNFWELEKRINEDKKCVGVCADMRRSKMLENLLHLLSEGAITREDLSPFSKDLQRSIDSFMRFFG